MQKHKHRLVLVRYMLAIEIVRLITKLVVALGMIFNYRTNYGSSVGYAI